MNPSYDEVRTALNFVSSDTPRHEWFSILCAIHDALGQNGYQLALDWSKQSAKFDQKNFDTTWSSIKPGAITKATLFEQAYKNGMPRPVKSDDFPTKKESVLPHSQNEPPIFDEPPIDAYDSVDCSVESVENDSNGLSTPTPNQPIANVQTTQKTDTDKAKKVLKQWNSLKPFHGHEYIVKKQLTGKLNGYEVNLRIGYAKNLGKFFAYPLLNLESKEIVGFNRISLTGKMLAKDSKKSGYATIIGNLDKDTQVVCVCEGFADGMHIHDFTKATVLVANDAGNLPVVCKQIRQLYPGTKIVVCADRDDAGVESVSKVSKIKNLVSIYPTKKDFSDDFLAGDLSGFDRIRIAIEQPIKGEPNSQVNDTLSGLSPELIAKLEAELDKAKKDEEKRRCEIKKAVEKLQNALADHKTPITKEATNALTAIRKAVGKRSSNEFALEIAFEHRDTIAYDVDSDEWRAYKNGIWEIVKPAKIQQAIQEKHNPIYGPDYGLSFIKGVQGLLSSYVSHTKWDCNRDLLPFKNGVLNVATKEFTDHDASHYFTWQLPYDYNPNATCKPILDWMYDALGDQNIIELIQAFFNACLFGRSYLQKYVELVGPGGTGKSTLIRLLVAMLGDNNCYSSELKQLENNRFETASIFGKRLVMITDAEGFAGGGNVLKAITGEDALRNESKNKQQGNSFIYRGMVVIAANQTIVFTDTSSAIPRRRITIEMSKVVAPADRRDLDSEFQPYIAGLVNWALAIPTEKVESLMRDTDKQVVATLDAKKIILIEGNTLVAWLHSCVEYCPGNKVKVGMLTVGKDLDGHDLDKYRDADSQLYPSYCRYCAQTNNKPVSIKSFSTRLIDVLNNTLGLSSVTFKRGYMDQQNIGVSFFEGLKISLSNEPAESIVDFAFLPRKKVEL